MRQRFITFATTCFFSLFVFVGTAFAISLDQAKAAGHIGELRNGYLGIVTPTPSAEVKNLVNDINGKRKAKYRDIAKRNGTPLSAVEQLAGKKAIQKTPSGYFVEKPGGGGWDKK